MIVIYYCFIPFFQFKILMLSFVYQQSLIASILEVILQKYIYTHVQTYISQSYILNPLNIYMQFILYFQV